MNIPSSPIVLFAFNRPEHLYRTLNALAANELAAQSPLTIFCDGPRTEQEEEKTNAVRKIAHAASGFSSLKVIEQEKNKGLASSIIAGVAFMLEHYERVIVLEDDLITSPFFLRYMNNALELYATSKNVASIHGYLFPHNISNPPETFFLRGTDCLGWGTWRRAWNVFEPDAESLLKKIRTRHLFHEFNVDGRFNYTAMLQGVAKGTVQSWAVRWHASAFLADMYTLHPGRSLVQHIGNDNSGTNFGTSNVLDVPLSSTPIEVFRIEVKRHGVMYKDFQRFMGNISTPTSTKGPGIYIKNTINTMVTKYKFKYSLSKLYKYIKYNAYRENFYPCFYGVFSNPFYLTRKALVQEIKKSAEHLYGTIIDFGSGTSPYKELLTNCKKYITIEYDSTENRKLKKADIFYDGLTIPLEDASVDGILSTQTLEHISNPSVILREWNRILKPDGLLLLTVPLMWPEHETPYDFQRYTSYGLINFLAECNFEIIYSKKLLADCRTPAQLFNAYLYDCLISKFSYKTQLILTVLLCSPVTLSAIVLSKILPSNSFTYTDNIILAKRK